MIDCREAVHVDVLPATRANSDSAWERESYTLEVEEDKLYDNILQLEIEGLQGDQMRRCQFYITNDEAPFVIDNQGRACAGPSGFLPDCVVHICIRKAALRWSFYQNVMPSTVSCCVANELFTPHLPHTSSVQVRVLGSVGADPGESLACVTIVRECNFAAGSRRAREYCDCRLYMNVVVWLQTAWECCATRSRCATPTTTTSSWR